MRHRLAKGCCKREHGLRERRATASACAAHGTATSVAVVLMHADEDVRSRGGVGRRRCRLPHVAMMRRRRCTDHGHRRARHRTGHAPARQRRGQAVQDQRQAEQQTQQDSAPMHAGNLRDEVRVRNCVGTISTRREISPGSGRAGGVTVRASQRRGQVFPGRGRARSATAPRRPSDPMRWMFHAGVVPGFGRFTLTSATPGSARNVPSREGSTRTDCAPPRSSVPMQSCRRN